MNKRKSISKKLRFDVFKRDIVTVMDAMDIATAKSFWNEKKVFKYFCGVCWNRIRSDNNG